MVKTKWLASLSDGTTVIEGKAPFAEVEGPLSRRDTLGEKSRISVLFLTYFSENLRCEGENVSQTFLSSL